MRGRKPKDVAMKRLAGNPGKHSLTQADAPDPFVCEAVIKPSWLNQRESAEWDRLTSTLAPILSRASEGMLLIAVQAFHQMMMADDIIAQHGFTYTTTTKEGAEMIRQRPEVGIRDRARRQYQQALAELAASPVASTRVRRLPEKKTAEEKKTGIARFFTS